MGRMWRGIEKKEKGRTMPPWSKSPDGKIQRVPPKGLARIARKLKLHHLLPKSKRIKDMESRRIVRAETTVPEDAPTTWKMGKGGMESFDKHGKPTNQRTMQTTTYHMRGRDAEQIEALRKRMGKKQ